MYHSFNIFFFQLLQSPRNLIIKQSQAQRAVSKWKCPWWRRLTCACPGGACITDACRKPWSSFLPLHLGSQKPPLPPLPPSLNCSLHWQGVTFIKNIPNSVMSLQLNSGSAGELRLREVKCCPSRKQRGKYFKLSPNPTGQLAVGPSCWTLGFKVWVKSLTV